MDVIETIRSRRTVHHFAPGGEVAPDVVREAIAVAVRAPNHKLTNPWRFHLVGAVTRGHLLALQLKLHEEKAGGSIPLEQQERLRAKMVNPAQLVIVSQVVSADPFRRREDYAACACAIQNLMLILWEQEIGSKWSTGALTRHPEAYSLCGIDADQEEIIAFLSIGPWAAFPETTPRAPLADILRELP